MHGGLHRQGAEARRGRTERGARAARALTSGASLLSRPCAWWQITSNIKNTVTGLKAVIGKKYHSEEIQNEITKVAYKMTESLGNVTIPVRPLPPAPRASRCAGRCSGCGPQPSSRSRRIGKRAVPRAQLRFHRARSAAGT